MDEINNRKIDKSVISIGDLDDITEDKKFWASKTPEERLRALELVRMALLWIHSCYRKTSKNS